MNFRFLVRICRYSMTTRIYSKQIRVPEQSRTNELPITSRIGLLDDESKMLETTPRTRTESRTYVLAVLIYLIGKPRNKDLCTRTNKMVIGDN